MENRSLLLGAATAIAIVLGGANAQAADPSIKTHDQAATGNKVMIDQVNLPSDGWIVIHAANEQVIGHAAVKLGENKNVSVTLDKPVKAGDRLVAMLHEDKGTKGKYEFGAGTGNADAPVMAAGKPVTAAFVVK